MVQCSTCGYDAESSHTFCMMCGERLPEGDVAGEDLDGAAGNAAASSDEEPERLDIADLEWRTDESGTSALDRLPGISTGKGRGLKNAVVGAVYLFVVFPFLFVLLGGLLLGISGYEPPENDGPGAVDSDETGNGDAEVTTSGQEEDSMAADRADSDGVNSSGDGWDDQDPDVWQLENDLETIGQQVDEEFNTEVEYEVDPSSDELALSATHSSANIGTPQMVAETRAVIAGYIVAIERGHDVGQMEVEVINTGTGETFGSYTVERDWVDAYLAGQITESELLDRIATTVRDSNAI